MPDISTKPYLIRAIHEWCADCGHTPYLAVAVDERTVVPRAYVKNGEIVLNVSMAATQRLAIGNDLIQFQARFGGMAHELSIPVENVTAIYARETGHGMAFDVPKAPAVLDGGPDSGPQGRAERSNRGDGNVPERPTAPPRKSRPTAVPPAPRPVEGEASAAPSVVQQPRGDTDAAPVPTPASTGPKLLPPPAAQSREDGASVDGARDAALPADGATTMGETGGAIPHDGRASPADAAVLAQTSDAQTVQPDAPALSPDGTNSDGAAPDGRGPDDSGPRPRRSGRPKLTRVK